MILFSIFWGERLNLLLNKVSSFSAAIYNACLFILLRGWIAFNFLVFFLSLSLGCKGNSFTKTTSSPLVSFFSLSHECKGACLACFLGLYTNLDKMVTFGLCFVILFMKLSGRNGKGACFMKITSSSFCIIFFASS